MARSASNNFLAVGLLAVLVVAPIFSIELNFGDVTEILNFSRETVTGVLEALEWSRKSNPEDKEYDFPFVKRMEKRLMNQISVVSEKIDRFEANMAHRSDEMVSTIVRDIPLRIRLDQSLHDMWREIGRVEDTYKNFVDYSKSTDKYEVYTMKEFAASCVSSASGALPDLLKDIHRLAVASPADGFDNSILVLLARNTKVSFSIVMMIFFSFFWSAS